VKKLFVAAAVLVLGMTAAAQSISLQFDGNVFKVLGWKPPASAPAGGWASVFVVYAGADAGTDIPPLAGSYAVEEGTLVFRPTYPIASGPRYRAVFHPPGGASIERAFPTGGDRYVRPTTRVDRVYPSANVLPSNQLRLYIYFSAPMSRGEAEQRIRLLDANGTILRGVFLPGQELWDPNNQRLTMTFDPGRIKRDLTSNRSMGPPIVDGKEYTLVIDREWRDAKHVPLVGNFRKSFRGGPAIRQPPDPKTWRLATPAAGTRAALVVHFGRPMNYTLLQRMLQVSSSGRNVAGSAAIALDETEWLFTPQAAWAPGAYLLNVDSSLEDLAGNHIGQPFDIDVFEHVTEHITSTTTGVAFEIRRAR
jgi:hypothetical protein